MSTRQVCLGLMLASLSFAAAQERASIRGVVRDTAGQPIRDAWVALAADQSRAAPAVRIATDTDGLFHFDALQAGDYTLTVERAGYAHLEPRVIHLPATPGAIAVDFTLTRLAGESPTKAPPRFQAAGVRGLIDPGGYSAPANAAAASGLVQGIAGIESSGNISGGAAAMKWPCDLAPALERAVQAEPDRAAAHHRLGQFYLAHEQISKAIAALQRARQLDNSDSDIVRDLAEALLRHCEFDAAEALVQKPSEQPGGGHLRGLLARAMEGTGRFLDAAHVYQTAAHEDPSEENYLGAGYEYILAGQSEQAARSFHEGERRFPASTVLLIGAGTAEFLLGHSAAAVLAFLRAAEQQPSDARAYPFLSAAFKISPTEPVRVRSSFRRSFEHSPASAESAYYYALSLPGADGAGDQDVDINRIETLLKRAVELDPRFAKAHYQLAALYGMRGDYALAVTEYEATLLLTPELADAHYRLAAAYRRIGQVEAAAREIQLFQQLRERDKANASEGLGIDQFVSVLRRRATDQGTPAACPDGGR